MFPTLYLWFADALAIGLALGALIVFLFLLFFTSLFFLVLPSPRSPFVRPSGACSFCNPPSCCGPYQIVGLSPYPDLSPLPSWCLPFGLLFFLLCLALSRAPGSGSHVLASRTCSRLPPFFCGVLAHALLIIYRSGSLPYALCLSLPPSLPSLPSSFHPHYVHAIPLISSTPVDEK
jgi:hypothetical protein